MKTFTKRNSPSLFSALLTGLILLGASMTGSAQSIDPVLETSRQAAQGTSASQARIDELDNRTQGLLGDFRANLKQLEQLNRYNASLGRQIAAQRQEADSLRDDINNIASLQRAIQPLMEDMVTALDELVDADMPFLLNERRSRVDRLQAIMDDPDMSPAQRYRLIVEVYQIEAEYGRTIETYRDSIETADRLYENVSVTRIGRIGLFFRTDDDQVLMRYDQATSSWVDLDSSYLSDIRTASRIANEQIPPQLMFLPVTAPVTGGE